MERPSADWGFGCHEYFVQYETADGVQGTFPAQGSYLYGDTCDSTLMWVDSQQGWEPDYEIRTDEQLEEDIEVRGCATVSPRGWLGFAALGALGALARRRKQ